MQQAAILGSSAPFPRTSLPSLDRAAGSLHDIRSTVHRGIRDATGGVQGPGGLCSVPLRWQGSASRAQG